MRRSYPAAAIVGGLLAFAVALDADVPATRSASVRQLRPERPADGGPAPTALRIKNVRLVAAPSSIAQPPSAVLKFDLANEGAQRLTDTLVEIVITERQGVQAETLNPRIIIGPVTIRGTATIEAGYTLEYQMLLRNLSAECECVANVVVLSARPLAF